MENKIEEFIKDLYKEDNQIYDTDTEFEKNYKLDKISVGTLNYKGLCYFWNYEYRHYLRDRSSRTLIKIHNTLLKAGLNVSEVSDKHEKIILKGIKGLRCKISGTSNKQYEKRKIMKNKTIVVKLNY